MYVVRPTRKAHTHTHKDICVYELLLLLTLAKCMVYNISSHHILWLLLLKQQVHKIFLSAFVIFLHHMHNGFSLIFLYTWLGMCTNGIWYKLEFYHHHVLSIWKWDSFYWAMWHHNHFMDIFWKRHTHTAVKTNKLL